MNDYYFDHPALFPAMGSDLASLICSCRAKLYTLISNDFQFNPANSEHVAAKIQHVKRLLSSGTLTVENDRFTAIFAVLEDLNKLNHLVPLSISEEPGKNFNFCVLDEPIAGVTEKIALIGLEQVKKQLEQLRIAQNLSLNNYVQRKADFQLRTQAIIKRPKHGMIEEVQHESIALHISRMMQLRTTKSLNISYKDQPALLVFFEDIRVLTEFSSGLTTLPGILPGWLSSSEPYTDYSTIKPLGEGLHPDEFIEDFGSFFSLFYLSSDTDAVGRVCQNKALVDARFLFIFDQVLMIHDKFVLDTRLNLQPSQYLLKYSRHGQGRNRTLIEDSKLSSKFNSLIQLVSLSEPILQYIKSLAEQYRLRCEQLKKNSNASANSAQRLKLNSELEYATQLKDDALKLHDALQARIIKVIELLPNASSIELILQCLILEKLLHNPVLFCTDGRPYKTPWTEVPTNKVIAVNEVDDAVEVVFQSAIPMDMLGVLIRHGAGSSLKNATTALKFSRADFLALREDMLHPELSSQFNPSASYLLITDLNSLSQAYKTHSKSTQMSLIVDYLNKMNSCNLDNSSKIDLMSLYELHLKQEIENTAEKGFAKHLFKKFQLDMQQRLQQMLPARPGNLNQACTAALKLDRITDFNAVVRDAISSQKTESAEFLGFLDYCELALKGATNYSTAQMASAQLAVQVQKIRSLFSIPNLALRKLSSRSGSSSASSSQVGSTLTQTDHPDFKLYNSTNSLNKSTDAADTVDEMNSSNSFQ